MRYISTRGQAPARDFAGVLLAGLAEDGGLFMPETWPSWSHADLRALRGLPYAELAARVMQPFIGDAVPFATLQTMCREAYAGFAHPAVVPLVQLETNLWSMELFHGPTLAFKDMAMQVIGRLFDSRADRAGRAGDHRRRHQRRHRLRRDRGRAGTAAGWTSCHPAPEGPHQRGAAAADDHGRWHANVANIAVDGTFDDCQDLVKAMFADAPFRKDLRLSAVNSINWARIAAQIPYYVAMPPSRWGRRNARWRSACPPAISATCWPPGPPGAWGCPLRGWWWPATATISSAGSSIRQRHEHGAGGTQPVALDGHPGQFQFRAPAVRTAGP